MLLERLLEILAEDGVLRPYAAGWECVRVPSSVGAGWQEHESRNPSFAAEIAITARCATNLAAVLKGAADPLHVLFPGGSTETAERLYSESPSAKTFNTLLAQAVRTASSSLESGRTLRVLEIGGGTGGSSVFVLPALPAGRTNYVFTDISPLFVARARERFAAFPFVTYSTLDIEKDPAKQGFTEGGFDLIVAANVVHATANLSQTLEHVSRLLAPGGVLLMLEVTQKERWIDLSFGMTEGWWKFEDRDLRPSYPLLAADRWKSLLARSGFSNVETVELSRESLNAILIAKRQSATLHTGENWLVVGESKNTALISAALSATGAQATHASNDVEAVIRARPWTGIVYVAPQRSTGDIRDAEAAICRPLFDIVHSIDLTASRLFVVTEGAQPATLTSVRNPEQATLWGAARTLASEYAGSRIVCIDLDPAAPARAVDLLIADVAAQDGEPEIAYRDGLRFVRRLNPAPLEKAERLRLSVEARGLIDNLRIEPAKRMVPGREQVEIEVDIAAIGFRDVLNVLGMYPGDPGPLGAECTGRIVAVGPGVREFAVGDSVVAVAPGCHDGYVVADARLVAHRPAGLTPEVAITLPVPYLTAIYALEHLGRISRGDSVLIHSAAGGVGLAAIQIAQRAGAEIFATAGSEEKRELLKSLGVKHVCSSRSTDFASYIERATAGRGVDIVLNSLAGEFTSASFSCIAHGGRFLEIGKNGIWTREQVDATRKDLSYFLIDWSEELRDNAQLIGTMLRRLLADAASGSLRPLPRTVFAFRDAVEAYRFMAQARHTGRVLLRQNPAIAISPERTYLVTGGLGGLGLLAAGRLVERGARNLILLGRSEPSREALDTVAGLERHGARVKIEIGDVSDGERLAAVVAAADPPLGGVIHSAGTLDDALFSDQSWERFDAVFRSKVYGAWNLHQLTAGANLDFFVIFSSIASILGAPGQANHAAANAFEDSLAWARRSEGLPATCINWGAWKGIGSADRPEFEQRRSSMGLSAFSANEGIDLFDRVLDGNPPQIAIARFDWSRYADGSAQAKLLEPMRRSSRPLGAAPAASSDAKRPALLDLLAGAPQVSRIRVIDSHVRSLANRILGAQSALSIDGRQPLNELGLDSLMAVEFRNCLSAATGRPIPVTLLFSCPAIDDVTGYVANMLFPAETKEKVAAASAAGGLPASVRTLDAIEELSDEEVDRLLAAKRGN